MNLLIQSQPFKLTSSLNIIFEEVVKITIVAWKILKNSMLYLCQSIQFFFRSSTQNIIDLTSFLWSWKYQAIYLRAKIIQNKICEKLFPTSSNSSTNQDLLSELIKAQNDTNSCYELIIKVEEKNKLLLQELASLKKEAQVLKIKQQVHENEKDLNELLQSVETHFNKLLQSNDLLILNEFQTAIKELLPQWQKKMENHIKIIESSHSLIDANNQNAQLTLMIIEYAKRPLILTKMILQLFVAIDGKLTSLLSIPQEPQSSNESIDDEMLSKMQKLQNLIASKNEI